MGMFLLIFVLFLSLFSDGQQEKHFLHYKFTVLTKADTFPEFSAVCVYDGRQLSHFSNKERVWIKESVHDWTTTLEEPADSKDWFQHQIRTLSDCTHSLCPELHVLQRIIGCELEKHPDGSVNLTVFDEFGFDGEDLISFDNTAQWIAKNPKAKIIKVEWDRQTGRNQFLKHYLKTCTDWISTLHNTKQSPPDVFVSARKSPDDSELVLTCLATGFYPRYVEMNIRLNGINLEDQTSSGIRPNADETFQKRISVKINRNHQGSYDCLVTHSNLTEEPVTVNWDRSSADGETESRWCLIAGTVLGGLGLLCWLCLVQKVQSQNVVESLTSVPTPDTEQAADTLVNYETGVALLTGN